LDRQSRALMHRPLNGNPGRNLPMLQKACSQGLPDNA
jgi:hypothetical protein